MSKNYTIVLNATDKNSCNCVKWARDKVPKLPFGLWTIFDKKKIINSHKAKIGRVAIMNVGLPWGHVGIITGKGSDRIVIKEANYKFCKITERQGTEKELKIIGYFNPNK
jgi:hypothetical protein